MGAKVVTPGARKSSGSIIHYEKRTIDCKRLINQKIINILLNDR